MSLLNRLFGRSYEKDLRTMLSNLSNREELLGIKPAIIPTPEGIKIDATRILQYTDSPGYRKFSQEAWGHITESLNLILDEKTTSESRLYHCGSVKALLDLLRVSYVAQHVVQQWDKEQKESPRPVSRSDRPDLRGR